MKKRLICLLSFFMVALLGVSLITGCTLTKNEKRYVKTFDGFFDTVSTVTIYASSQKEANTFFSTVRDEMKRLSCLYDIYYEYDGINNLATLNKNAGQGMVTIDKDLVDLLSFAIEAEKLTNGYVNIALGSVLSLWHEKRVEALENPDTAGIPDENDLRAAFEHTDINDLILNIENNTAELADPLLALDVGALAKGFAAEKIAQKMEGLGYLNFALNLGGNLRVSGSAGGQGWKISVKNPLDGNQTVGKMEKTGPYSLVTSGSYQRYYEVDGIRYHHIISKDTLQPANAGWTSVSVYCQDSGIADMLSTALFCLGYSEGVSLIEGIDSTIEVLWIADDGESLTYSTSGGSSFD